MPVYIIDHDMDQFHDAEKVIEGLPNPEYKEFDLTRGSAEEIDMLLGLADRMDNYRIAYDAYNVYQFEGGEEVIMAITENYYLIDPDDVLSEERPELARSARSLGS